MKRRSVVMMLALLVVGLGLILWRLRTSPAPVPVAIPDQPLAVEIIEPATPQPPPRMVKADAPRPRPPGGCCGQKMEPGTTPPIPSEATDPPLQRITGRSDDWSPPRRTGSCMVGGLPTRATIVATVGLPIQQVRATAHRGTRSWVLDEVTVDGRATTLPAPAGIAALLDTIAAELAQAEEVLPAGLATTGDTHGGYDISADAAGLYAVAHRLDQRFDDWSLTIDASGRPTWLERVVATNDPLKARRLLVWYPAER